MKPWESQVKIKQDPLTEWIEKIVVWIKTHKQLAFGMGAGGGVSILLLILFILTYRQSEERAWERLAYAEGFYAAGQLDQSLNQIQDLLSKYPRRTAGTYSHLLKGDILTRQKKYREAMEIYQKVVNRKKPKELVPWALYNIGFASEQLVDFENAIKNHQIFIDQFPEHYLAASVYMALARIHELSGNKTQAKATYERISAIFPATQWAEIARSNLSKIK